MRIWTLIFIKNNLDDNQVSEEESIVVLCLLLQGHWENPNLGLIMLCSQITDIYHKK